MKNSKLFTAMFLAGVATSLFQTTQAQTTIGKPTTSMDSGNSTGSMSAVSNPPQTNPTGSAPFYYTCPMHPFVHEDKPGKCPVCAMDLVKRMVAQTFGSPVESSDSSEVLKGLAPVQMTDFQAKSIDVQTTTVQRMSVARMIHTTGRFAGGEGDFGTAASGFLIQSGGVPSSVRYLVADVYALDQPFLKMGQRAWITPLGTSGQKLEGKVTKIYPWDGTQSRIVRVKVSLKRPMVNALYADVQIEAETSPSLAVPRQAILNTGTQNYLYVQTAPGQFKPQAVQVGFLGDDYAQVTGGLNEGDTVASGGTFMLDADSHLASGIGE